MCGGGAGAGIQLNTCEKNIYGQDTWAKMTSLPEARFGVRALTIDNTVFMIGKHTKFYVPIISCLCRWF